VQDEEEDADNIAAKDSYIPIPEMSKVLHDAEVMASKSEAEILEMGWKLVHKNDLFTLYKRRQAGRNDGPVEYLMTGSLDDVSPRTWLFSQVDKACRGGWDKTMKDMSEDENTHTDIVKGDDSCEDVLYYRTKWPWPLKDRDYTLARRCYEFKDKNALVFISKSVDKAESYPTKSGVIRVDNYWCHSTFISHPRETAPESPGSVLPEVDEGVGSSSEAVDIDGEVPVAQEASVSYSSGESDQQSSTGGVSRLPGLVGGSTAAMGARPRGAIAGGASRTKMGSLVDKPGMRFVTIFCDDQQVPLPPKLIDLLSKVQPTAPGYRDHSHQHRMSRTAGVSFQKLF
jgi:hypothetical protein